MNPRIRILVALAVPLSLTGAVAVAKTAPTQGAPLFTAYKGADAAGPVSFSIYGLYAGNPPAYAFNFRFANDCAERATTVHARMDLGAKRHFVYHKQGISISATAPEKLTTHGTETLKSFPTVTGTVRVRTSSCDSGKLTFTATEGKTT